MTRAGAMTTSTIRTTSSTPIVPTLCVRRFTTILSFRLTSTHGDASSQRSTLGNHSMAFAININSRVDRIGTGITPSWTTLLKTSQMRSWMGIDEPLKDWFLDVATFPSSSMANTPTAYSPMTSMTRSWMPHKTLELETTRFSMSSIDEMPPVSSLDTTSKILGVAKPPSIITSN